MVKKQSHRTPPKPIHWNCKRGNCRFCGEQIIEDGKQNTRKHWHQACADIWTIMNNPRTARRAVSRRDKHTCQVCGKNCRGEAYDIDHVKPLFEANNDPTYWQLGNLRLLCKDCHKVKTREDMVRFRASQIKCSSA